MLAPDQYELLDAGGGRKLERFGAEILDRPSPAAEGITVADPDRWASATVRFDAGRGGSGEWERLAATTPDDWAITHGRFRLGLQLRPSANIGVFPEQADNWDWIDTQVRRMVAGDPSRSPKVLNLFAYTGGSTLAAAAAGAEVTHVDSSGPTVNWAKRNAAESGLAGHPVRWLVEDAMRFVAREARRGNRYDGVIADPPTYGHGPKGRPFKFRQHLEELLAGCASLLPPEAEAPRFLLFSCHAPGFGVREVAEAVGPVSPAAAELEVSPLDLTTRGGRRLGAGVGARWVI